MLCLQNASLSRADKSPILVTAHGSLGVGGIAQQMRHLLGPVGGSGRQDVLYVAEDEKMKGSFLADEVFEAREGLPWRHYVKLRKSWKTRKRGLRRGGKLQRPKGIRKN